MKFGKLVSIVLIADVAIFFVFNWISKQATGQGPRFELGYGYISGQLSILILLVIVYAYSNIEEEKVKKVSKAKYRERLRNEELKLKVFDHITEKIYYALNINLDNSLVEFEIDGVKIERHLSDVELLRYTGLTAMENGIKVDVHEGDTLGDVYSDGYIRYCNECKQFQYHIQYHGIESCMGCAGEIPWQDIVLSSQNGDLVKTGNIYLNPELIAG